MLALVNSSINLSVLELIIFALNPFPIPSHIAAIIFLLDKFLIKKLSPQILFPTFDTDPYPYGISYIVLGIIFTYVLLPLIYFLFTVEGIFK